MPSGHREPGQRSSPGPGSGSGGGEQWRRGAVAAGGGGMSGQRSGVLELAVLGLLHENPMHGSELGKRLNAVLGAFRAFGYGSLYPCLKQLLAEGLIAEEPPSGTARPAGRRSKIVYRPAAGGKGGGQGLPGAGGPPVEDRVPADRGWQGAASGTSGRVRPGGLGGRRVRRALRVLRPDQSRYSAADPRRAPQSSGGTPGRFSRRAGENPGTPGQLHP